MWALTIKIVLFHSFFVIYSKSHISSCTNFINSKQLRLVATPFKFMAKQNPRQQVPIRRCGKTKKKKKVKHKQVVESEEKLEDPRQNIDMKQLEQEAKEYMKYLESEEHQLRVQMERATENTDLYLNVFNIRDPITRADLIGHDIPYGLVPPERYELMKLYGRLGDPCHPLMVQSITVHMFAQRLFGSQRCISKNEFCYKLDYRMPFYLPGYGEVFLIDKIRCLRGWFVARGLVQAPEDPNPDIGEIKLVLRPNQYRASDALRHVNSEISRQGIHPAMLDMLWDFFTDNPTTVSRDEVCYKLNFILDRVKHRHELEGISPDNFFYVFRDEAKRRLENFDREECARNQLRAIYSNELYQLAISQNAMVRKRRKILSNVYREQLEGLYTVNPPDLYKEYEKEKLGEYRALLKKVKGLQLRRKALRADPNYVKPVKVKVEKEKREKKESRRNRRQGKG